MVSMAHQQQTNNSNATSSGIPDSPVIMQIIPELGPGGAEQGCIDIAVELVRAGSQAIVVSHGGSRLHELARAGATHIDLPVHSKNPFVMWKNIGRLRKIIKKYNVDIVHVRSRAPAWSAMIACKKSTAKYMSTCHAPYNINGNIKRFYNSAITKGERVIAISNFVAQYLLDNYKIDPRNIRLVHRGIRLEKFHPNAVTPAQLIQVSKQWRLPDGANIIMLPGRITRLKGHLILIDAISKINRPDIFCVLIGSDQGRVEYRQELEDAITKKNLGSKIRIINHCDDMPAAYMLSTIAICASTDPEGFGRVPVEAQAMGRPIIATDHGGAQETIIRNETGWLVPPGDADAMARAIEEALDLTPEQREILATRSMAHIAEHFTCDKMADQTLNVYAELLQEKYNIPSFENNNSNLLKSAAE